MFARIRYRLLDGWAAMVCRRPWWVIAASLLLTAASVAVTVAGLEFQSDRNALLSPDLEWNRRFEQWRASFPGNEDFYVVVDSGQVQAADRAKRLGAARSLVDELGAALADSGHVESAVWRFDAGRFSPKTLRLEPMDRFVERLTQIREAEVLLVSPTPGDLFRRVMERFREPDSTQRDESDLVRSIEGLTGLVNAVHSVITAPPQSQANLGALVEAGSTDSARDGGAPGSIYLTSDNGRLFFIRVTPRKAVDTINAFVPAIEAIRGMIDRSVRRYPGLEAGLTGVDVVETDETEAATRDSTIASIIASVLITALLITAFHTWRTPLLMMVALLTGVAWSFGFLTLAIGHLQVLSVVFTVILLGAWCGVRDSLGVADRAGA